MWQPTQPTLGPSALHPVTCTRHPQTHFHPSHVALTVTPPSPSRSPLDPTLTLPRTSHHLGTHNPGHPPARPPPCMHPSRDRHAHRSQPADWRRPAGSLRLLARRRRQAGVHGGAGAQLPTTHPQLAPGGAPPRRPCQQPHGAAVGRLAPCAASAARRALGFRQPRSPVGRQAPPRPCAFAAHPPFFIGGRPLRDARTVHTPRQPVSTPRRLQCRRLSILASDALPG